DVAALCPRVVVIDKGQLSYDGGLNELVQRVSPEKRVVLQIDGEVDAQKLASLGKVVTREPGRVVLQVMQSNLNATISRALSELPVKDFNVENAPLEEVMSELFSRSRAAREHEAHAEAS
ncbi:MAG: ABC transporter, partial [Myxococcaceae bacterium]